MSPRAALQLAAAFLAAAAIFNLGYHSAPAMLIVPAHDVPMQTRHHDGHHDPAYDGAFASAALSITNFDMPGPTASTAGPCLGLTNFGEPIPVAELMLLGNYSKKGYFAALRSTRGYRGGHQRLHLPPQNATNPPIAGPLVTPLCLEAGGGAAILPTSCLEKEGYRFAVFVGASLAREIAWAFARLTFDPPPTGTKPGDGLGEGYCHPYAASGAGEEASQDSSSNLRGTRSRTRVNAGGDNVDVTERPGWDRSVFRSVTNANMWPNMNCSRGLAKSADVGCTLDTGFAGHYRPEERTFLDPDDADFDPKKAADAQVFNFARDPAECCDPAGGAFWTRMVQLDEPVRHQGRNRKIQHDRLVQLLVEQLAKNCPCKGLLWIGIGVHELKHGRPWYRDPAAIDPAEYGSRSWVKEAEDKYYAKNGLKWAYPFGRELGLKSMLRHTQKTLAGTQITQVLADTVRPQPLIMHATPAKKWADTEGFGDMIGLSEMFHVVDRAVAADFGIPLIPYYQATKAYGGLQCDGIHFGKSSGELYGCTGFPVVTDVVVQAMLNKVCRNVAPNVGCRKQ